MTRTQSSTKVNGLFGQTMETFEAAMKTGAKIQEESMNRFTELLGELGSPQNWQKRTQEAVEEGVNLTRKNFDEWLRLMNENVKMSLELLQKAAEARPSDTPVETEARKNELWEASLRALRVNTQAVLQANSRMMEALADLAKVARDETR